jgi:DNA-nicking Smr family endonuclease
VASDKQRKPSHPPLEPAFHAPFRDLADALKRRPPKQATAPHKSVPLPPAHAPSARPAPPICTTPAAPPRVETQSALTEEQALATSREGAARLAAPPARVRIRRKPDLSHIEAKRQEDLAAMARGEGFDVTFDDLHVRARASSVSRETLSRLEKGEFAISAHLDLHGMPFDDARRAVDEFLALQQKKGRRCVLIVTGKGKNSPNGQGVLRERVPQWLARGPSARRVLAFASARPCDGGVGALVVLMRATSSSKDRIDVEHGGTGPVGP